jgi:hypothetical protein
MTAMAVDSIALEGGRGKGRGSICGFLGIAGARAGGYRLFVTALAWQCPQLPEILCSYRLSPFLSPREEILRPL